MNAIILSELSQDILWGIGIFSVALAVTFIILFWAKSPGSRYLDEIIYLEYAVKNWYVLPSNYREIKKRLLLIECHNQDPDRTFDLYAKFFIKYERLIKAEILKTEAKKVNQEVEV